MDDETRSEFAKLKTRLFILESKVEMLLSQTQFSKGKPMAKKNDPSSVNPVGHVECTFPSEIPLHSLKHLVDTLRGAEPLVINEALQHVGCALGSIGKLMGPQAAGSASESALETDPSEMTDEELACELESLAINNPPQSGAFDAGHAAFIPPFLIPILLTIAQRLLERWFRS